MKARRLLEEFKNCDADQFTAITEALEKENQGHLAKLLKKTMEDIKNEEANTGSDFVGNLYKNLLLIYFYNSLEKMQTNVFLSKYC